MLHVLGLHPYSCEGFGCFLSGSDAEKPFLEYAEGEGISETFCSYHKIFIGAAEKALMPRPQFIISTSLACDANMLTFRRLADFYKVPHFMIDVPYRADEDAIEYVTKQLIDMKNFIEEHTKRRIAEDRLKEVVSRSQSSISNYRKYLDLRSDRLILNDLTGELFSAFMLHTLLGTKETEEYTKECVNEARKAENATGLRLVWMHTTPFWVEELRKKLNFNRDVQIVGCDMSFEGLYETTSTDPYRIMAERLVHSSFNGPVRRRIERGIAEAKRLNADGAIWFCHWRCKHTLGGAQLAKKKFEEAGFPCLILDGDGADRSHGGEGQLATRVDAFIEMLKKKKERG